MKHQEEKGTLVDQQLALGVYLEALLAEPAVETRTETVEVPVEAPVERPVEVATPAVEAAVEAAAAPAPAEAPDWTTTSFQVLMFRVWGLTLSVPLVKLYGVLPWPDNLTPVFGHADWFMGLVRNQNRNTQVMDTAQLVLPPHKLAALRADQERVFSNIILIDEGRSGLACDEIEEVITLRPEDVQWRGAEGKRPWLAGTVKEHMCALLEVDEFIRMIHSIKTPEDLEAFNE